MADKDIKKEESELEDELTPEDEAIAPEDDKALSENADQNDNKDTKGLLQNQAQTAQNQAQASTPPTQEQAPQAPMQQPPVQQDGMTQGQQGQSDLMNGYLNFLATIPKDQNVLQRGAEAMAFADDLHNGKIQPKTMESMFADKGTVGKIGTIFGLMLSGAGSGLAHQSNALLDMMNKEIERDLEAQKNNQTNKLNWYNAAVHHEYTNMQNQAAKANIMHTLANAAYQNALADFQKGKNKAAGYAESNGTTQAANYMRAFIPSLLQNIVDSNGYGPVKALGEQAIDNHVAPYFANKIHQDNINQANKNELFHKTNSKPVVNPSTDQQGSVVTQPNSNEDLIQNPVDLKKLDQAIKKGDLGIPGMDSLPDKTQALTDAQKIQNLRKAAKAYTGVIQFLDGMKNEGQVPLAGALTKGAQGLITGLSAVLGGIPGAIGGAIGGSLIGKTGETFEQYFERARNATLAKLNAIIDQAGMSPEEKKSITTTLMGQWYDTPENKKALFDNAQEIFKNKENTIGANLHQNGFVKPFPQFEYNPVRNPEKEKFLKYIDKNVSEKIAPTQEEKNKFLEFMKNR